MLRRKLFEEIFKSHSGTLAASKLVGFYVARPSPRFVFCTAPAACKKTKNFIADEYRRAQAEAKQRVCQFSFLFLWERPRRAGKKVARERRKERRVGTEEETANRRAMSLWRLVPGKRLGSVEAPKRKETLGRKNRGFI